MTASGTDSRPSLVHARTARWRRNRTFECRQVNGSKRPTLDLYDCTADGRAGQKAVIRVRLTPHSTKLRIFRAEAANHWKAAVTALVQFGIQCVQRHLG